MFGNVGCKKSRFAANIRICGAGPGGAKHGWSAKFQVRPKQSAQMTAQYGYREFGLKPAGNLTFLHLGVIKVVRIV